MIPYEEFVGKYIFDSIGSSVVGSCLMVVRSVDCMYLDLVELVELELVELELVESELVELGFVELELAESVELWFVEFVDLFPVFFSFS